MPESLRQLEENLRAKEHELDSISSATTGAGIGALLTQGSPIGAAIGAAFAHDKEKKNQIERDIATIKQKIQDTHNQISRLESKKSDLMNQFQNDKARFEADTRQKYNDLERIKLNEPNPDIARTYDEKLSRLQSDSRDQEVNNDQAHQQALDTIQQEISQLTA